MYDSKGNDTGWKDSQSWWWDENDPNRFDYAQLDKDYPAEYFPRAEMPEAVIEAYCKYVQEFYEKITGKKMWNIVEFGPGGGWFMKRLMDNGFSVYGYEGSQAGVKACTDRGIPKYKISWKDFRLVFRPDVPQSDIVLCTEVGEHLPVSLHGNLVQNLVQHGDLIWWSHESPDTNQAHLHHPGEQPDEYWIALFNFFGFGCYRLPSYVRIACAERAKFIFYRRTEYEINIKAL